MSSNLDKDVSGVRKRSVSLVIAGLILAELVGAFESGMALQLLYSNDPFFGTDIAKLSWIVTAYSLVAAASVGICGRLGDQFGRRKVLIVVLLLATVGSLVSALAPNVEIVIAGRAVQGIAACILPLTFGIARQVLPDKKVPLAFTLLGLTATAAGAGGILLAGVIIDHFTWPVMFYACAVLSLIACVSTLVMIPEDSSESMAGGRIDYLGVVLFAVGIWAVLYAITKASDWGFTSSRTLLFAGMGAAVLALWTKWELRVSDPVFELRRFRNPKFSLTMVATALCGLALLGMAGVFNKAVMRTPEYLASSDGTTIDLPVGLGFTATQAGIPSVLGALIGYTISPMIARLCRTLGAARTVMIAFVIGIVAYVGFLFTYSSAVAFVINMVVLVALALGFALAGLPMLIVECVPQTETSAATGMQLVVRTAFTGVGTAGIGIILALSTIDVGPRSFLSETGLQVAVLVGVTVSVVGLAIVFAASRLKASEPDNNPRHADTPVTATAE
ncbi:MFS transporter [Rhodococcus sp. USK13]|uniref:MFS transporter n=1 Tax=Rhodococcus sp. USK13 TaxID=2806442 RepID=UPI001BCC72F5|nr:MFS transporter [Rhodococcus sp. USK13]